MLQFKKSSRVIVTCNKRLSPYLEAEVRALGFEPESVFVTGVVLNASLDDCIRLNLNLRCASQVLYSLKAFMASDPDDVYQALSSYPWENIFPSESGYFSVTSNVMNPTINNNLFANVRVKDAIVDRLREKTGKRPSTGSELSGTVIHLFWKNEDAEVFLDTSGDSLARHGYRKIPGRAPMLEALASATLYATRWDRSSPFINPMCGSGTIAIEAALLATDRRPGIFRDNYAFMHVEGYDERVYQEEMKMLKSRIKDVPGLQIIATDYSGMAIRNARMNAEAAGVADLIHFSICDFAETEVPAGRKGVVYLNPEYGERLGEQEALEYTYREIGDFFKKSCGGYYGYIFTGNLELAKKVGLKAKRRIEFYTSTIDCRLMEYELYEGTRRVPKDTAAS